MTPDRLTLLIIASGLAAQPTANVEQIAQFCQLHAEYRAACRVRRSTGRDLARHLAALSTDKVAGQRLAAAILVARKKCRIILGAQCGGCAGGPQRRRAPAAPEIGS